MGRISSKVYKRKKLSSMLFIFRHQIITLKSWANFFFFYLEVFHCLHRDLPVEFLHRTAFHLLGILVKGHFVIARFTKVNFIQVFHAE